MDLLILELLAESGLPRPLHCHALFLKHFADLLVCWPRLARAQKSHLSAIVLRVGIPLGVRVTLYDAHIIPPHHKLLNQIRVLESKISNLLARSRRSPEEISNRAEEAPLLAELIIAVRGRGGC